MLYNPLCVNIFLKSSKNNRWLSMIAKVLLYPPPIKDATEKVYIQSLKNPLLSVLLNLLERYINTKKDAIYGKYRVVCYLSKNEMKILLSYILSICILDIASV